MSRNALMQRVKQGLVTVLDIRPQEEYAAGHLPGAINIPPDELEHRLQDGFPEWKSAGYPVEHSA